MTRVFSGIQPTGEVHLGNYLGAIRRWAQAQHEDDAIHCIVDLHALTIPQDPAVLRAKVIETAQILVAAGLDPELCTLFVQSHVPEHPELSWVMECTAAFGELRRMVQFKEKSDQADFVSAGLFAYPALQAADILLYDTEKVPVGDDQRQHIELARDLAIRFNNRYGETFVVPEHAIAPVAARVMDLQHPGRKMSKSVDSPLGTVLALDEPEVIRRKFRRAVTDSETEVRYDPEAKPGVANLLSILAAATDDKPEALADKYSQYGPLKDDAADATIELFRPLQKRFAELAADPAETRRILATGAAKARAMAAPKLALVRERLGLLLP
ncbi:MAG TPA: tryptophan--tRNA ligase [Acidimicrobiales bacterium]|jgi:tryptophanyl-tRNA synthetase|nr:tryptophan--tRNA ligase [Acidimicrobiales bacterium]